MTATEGTLSAINTAGKAISSVGEYAAPALDITAAGVCVVASDGLCAAALGANFGLQQILAADQAVYNPDTGLIYMRARTYDPKTAQS